MSIREKLEKELKSVESKPEQISKELKECFPEYDLVIDYHDSLHRDNIVDFGVSILDANGQLYGVRSLSIDLSKKSVSYVVENLVRLILKEKSVIDSHLESAKEYKENCDKLKAEADALVSDFPGFSASMCYGTPMLSKRLEDGRVINVRVFEEEDGTRSYNLEVKGLKNIKQLKKLIATSSGT